MSGWCENNGVCLTAYWLSRQMSWACTDATDLLPTLEGSDHTGELALAQKPSRFFGDKGVVADAMGQQ
jgi:hypothetical protein